MSDSPLLVIGKLNCDQNKSVFHSFLMRPPVMELLPWSANANGGNHHTHHFAPVRTVALKLQAVQITSTVQWQHTHKHHTTTANGTTKRRTRRSDNGSTASNTTKRQHNRVLLCQLLQTPRRANLSGSDTAVRGIWYEGIRTSMRSHGAQRSSSAAKLHVYRHTSNVSS